MIRTTATILTDNAAEIAGVTALVTEKSNLDQVVSDIDALTQAQQSPLKGITLDKENVMNQMIDQSLLVAGALRATASVNNDQTLLKKAEMTRSRFTKARDEKRDDQAQEIHDLGQKYIATLAPYGVTAATLTTLQTLIDNYRTIVVGPQTARAVRSTTTHTLENRIDFAMEILRNRIDGLMEQFKTSGTSFYADYHNARKIVDLHGPGKQPATPPTP